MERIGSSLSATATQHATRDGKQVQPPLIPKIIALHPEKRAPRVRMVHHLVQGMLLMAPSLDLVIALLILKEFIDDRACLASRQQFREHLAGPVSSHFHRVFSGLFAAFKRLAISMAAVQFPG